MNLRWFAKHYHLPRALQQRLGTAFLVSWFVVRLPALWALIAFMAWHWTVIYDKMPKRIAILGSLLVFGINALHVAWGFLLIQKLRPKHSQKKIADFAFEKDAVAGAVDVYEAKSDKADTETDHL